MEMIQKGAVLRVVCDHKHTIVVTRDGGVYSWGNGRDGQLGQQASYSDVFYPLAITNPAIHIIQASAGRSHSAFLTTTGFVLTCGSNGMSELGIIPGTTELPPHTCPILSSSPSMVPRVVSSLSAEHIVQLSCGEAHTAVLTSNGKVYIYMGK